MHFNDTLSTRKLSTNSERKNSTNSLGLQRMWHPNSLASENDTINKSPNAINKIAAFILEINGLFQKKSCQFLEIFKFPLNLLIYFEFKAL